MEKFREENFASFEFWGGERKKIICKGCKYVLIGGDVCIWLLFFLSSVEENTIGKYRAISVDGGEKWLEYIVLFLKEKLLICMGKE